MEAAEYDLDADLEQLELNIMVSWNLVNGLAQACEELELSLEDAAEIVSIVEEKLLVGRGTVLDQLEAEEIVAQTDVTLLEKTHGTGAGPRRPAAHPRRALPLVLTRGVGALPPRRPVLHEGETPSFPTRKSPAAPPRGPWSSRGCSSTRE